MTNVQNFGSLGKDFQLKLLSQIIFDRKFGISLTPIINPNYFDDSSCKLLMSLIKQYSIDYPNSIPTQSGLKEMVLSDNRISEADKVYSINIIKELKSKMVLDSENTQKLARNFCKQQEMIKAISDVNKIISSGNFEDYDKIENIIVKAQQKGIVDDNSIEVDHDLDKVLEEDYRNPIPTGIEGLDRTIRGGLAKGELGMFICATGVGKSTILTKIANTAYYNGFNVLQIFFEDKEVDIQRKHCSSLTHLKLNELHLHKESVRDALDNAKINNGKLILKKYPSDSTTVNHIKQQLRILKNKGIKIDMLIVDYVDCLTSDRSNEDYLQGEGAIIRQLESLCGEEDVALWTAVQSNRSGAGTEDIDVSMIQGSFKRAQVGHLIIGIGKTQEQKTLGLATMHIIKSRFGGDGVVFKNMTFRNDTMTFDTEEQSILTTMVAGSDETAEFLDNQKNEIAMKAMLANKEHKEALKRARENNIL